MSTWKRLRAHTTTVVAPSVYFNYSPLKFQINLYYFPLVYACAPKKAATKADIATKYVGAISEIS